MRPNIRTASGVVLMLAIIPIFAGLLACMPVPIGDPAKSRIDPEISGIWALELDDEFNAFYLFRPFDERVWLITGVPIEEGDSFEGELPDLDSAQDAFGVLRDFSVGDEGITATSTLQFKGWTAKLGGDVFMTWETIGSFDDEGFTPPEFWYVFRVQKRSADRIDLFVVSSEHDAFDDLEEPEGGHFGHDYPRSTRRQWERVLKKIAKSEEDAFADDPWVLHRVPNELVDGVAELFTEIHETE